MRLLSLVGFEGCSARPVATSAGCWRPFDDFFGDNKSRFQGQDLSLIKLQRCVARRAPAIAALRRAAMSTAAPP